MNLLEDIYLICVELEKHLGILPEYIHVRNERVFCDGYVIDFGDLKKCVHSGKYNDKLYQRFIGNRAIVPIFKGGRYAAYFLSNIIGAEVFYYDSSYIILLDGVESGYILVGIDYIITNAYSSNDMTELIVKSALNSLADKETLKSYVPVIKKCLGSYQKSYNRYADRFLYFWNMDSGEVVSHDKIIYNVYTGSCELDSILDVFMLCDFIRSNSNPGMLPKIKRERAGSIDSIPLKEYVQKTSEQSINITEPIEEVHIKDVEVILKTPVNTIEEFKQSTSHTDSYVDLSNQIISYLKSNSIRYTKASVEEVCRVLVEDCDLSLTPIFTAFGGSQQISVQGEVDNYEKKSGQVALFCKKNNITEEYFWEHEADNFCKILECAREELDTELGQFI